jgi:hypothetical protein
MNTLFITLYASHVWKSVYVIYIYVIYYKKEKSSSEGNFSSPSEAIFRIFSLAAQTCIVSNDCGCDDDDDDDDEHPSLPICMIIICFPCVSSRQHSNQAPRITERRGPIFCYPYFLVTRASECAHRTYIHFIYMCISNPLCGMSKVTLASFTTRLIPKHNPKGKIPGLMIIIICVRCTE